MTKILKKTILVTAFSISLVLNVFGMESITIDEDTLNQHLSSSQAANEFFHKGVKQYKKGYIDSAIEYLTKAINLDKEFAYAHYMLSVILVEKNDERSRVFAERAIKIAILLKPKEILYHYYKKLMKKKEIKNNFEKKPYYHKSLNSVKTEFNLKLKHEYKMKMEYYNNMDSIVNL